MLKIYITDLAAYNKGYLFGEWISLPCENMKDELDKIIKGGEALCFMQEGYYEKHEEWFISDYEWEDIDIFEVTEYEDIFTLNKQLEKLEECSSYDLKAISFLLNDGIVNDLDEAIIKACDVIIHENTRLEDYAYALIKELYCTDTLPPIIANHIDYDSIARDLEIEGNYTVVGNDIYEYIS